MSIQYTQEIVEQEDVVHRYLHGKLTAEEQILFEEYVMEHPEILEHIQIDEIFVRSMGEVNSKRAVNKSRFWSTIKWVGTGALGAYASVMLMTLINPSTPVAVGIDQMVYIDTVRSSAPTLQRIALSKSNEQLALLLPTQFNQAGPFDVSIVDDDTNKTLVQIESVEKTEDDDIAVLVNSRMFKSGLYRLSSTDVSSNETITITVEFYEHSTGQN